MRKIYDPVVSVGDGDIVGGNPASIGLLSELFTDWLDNPGFTCLDMTGDGKRDVRDILKKEGVYFFPGFVGVVFWIKVIEE